MATSYSAKWNKFYSAFSEALLDCGHQFTKQGETMLANAAEEHLKKLDDAWLADKHPMDRWVTDRRTGRAVYGDAIGSHNHPWFSGTLHDSISVRIAEGGRTVAVRFMPSAAVDNQFADPEPPYNTWVPRYYPEIEGASFGRLMAGRASQIKPNAISAQMFIGAPHAQHVNMLPDHEGYIETMQAEFISDIEDVFAEQKIRNLIIRPRK